MQAQSQVEVAWATSADKLALRIEAVLMLGEDKAAGVSGRTSMAEQPGTATVSKYNSPLPS